MSEEVRADPRIPLLRELGDPIRLRVIDRLSNTGSATVSELAAALDLPMTTLSNHLRRLRDARLITATPRGRHVIYALSDPGIELLLPLLDRLTGRLAPAPDVVPATPRASAGTCYDHLAGRLGVELYARLLGADALREQPDGTVAVGADPRAFEALGVTVPEPGRRRFAFECLDAIHHRPHLGGALGAAILDALVERGWVTLAGDRVVTTTAAGRRGLEAALGRRIRRSSNRFTN